MSTMLSADSEIIQLPSNIVEQLQKIDDFYVCTRSTEDMIGPPIAYIGNELYFRFMNFIYLAQPLESLTTEQVKRLCDVRLEHIDELVNYQINSIMVDTITDCVRAKKPSGQRCRLSRSGPALFEGSEQGLTLVAKTKARELLALSAGGLLSQLAPTCTIKPSSALLQKISMVRILLPPGAA